MLVKSRQNEIHERILTAKNGQLIRVRFAIVEVQGVMRGRVISATPIISVAAKNMAAETKLTQPQLYLPGSVARDIFEAVESTSAKSRLSPYVSFEFFMSQPTRAPSA